MSQTLVKIKRELANPGAQDGESNKYLFTLYDGELVVGWIEANSPIAPKSIRHLQAKINSSRVLDDLGIF